MTGLIRWWETHEFIASLIARFNVDLDTLAYPGTAEWLALADDDAAKRATLLIAADHQVLRLETQQIDQAEAAKVVSAAADWRRIGTEWGQLQAWRAANPWAKRVSA